MNNTPLGNRFHIGIFGKCNSGKSSLMNAITNQNIAIISEKKGTTTDPVFKAMEIPKIGPSMLIDTPGIDDNEEHVGIMRANKSFNILNYVDAAILILKNSYNISKYEKAILEKIKIKNIPLIIVINEFNLNQCNATYKNTENYNIVKVNAKTKKNINILIDAMSQHFKTEKEPPIISDLLKPMDIILLVIVMDKAYPKARLILPQQQLINDILRAGAICYVCRLSEYEEFIKNLKTLPKLIITDSQIFSEIFSKTPQNILVTSFSILLARQKGILKDAMHGVKTLNNISSEDSILILESCTHKKKACDVGSIKIPKWIKNYTKRSPNFKFLTGVDFEENIKKYKLVVHCGGCMTTANRIKNRFKICKQNNVAITNYGILIAYIKGVLEKSTEFLNKL